MQRQRRRDGSVAYSRQGLNAPQAFFIEGNLFLVAGVFGWRQRNIQREDVTGIETEVDFLEAVKAADQRSGTHQQKHGDANLENHERASEEGTPSASNTAPAFIPQYLVHVGS